MVGHSAGSTPRASNQKDGLPRRLTTVACPNCGSTATHNVGVVTGSSPAYCNQCKKGFRIYMKQGRLDQVKKG